MNQSVGINLADRWIKEHFLAEQRRRRRKETGKEKEIVGERCTEGKKNNGEKVCDEQTWMRQRDTEPCRIRVRSEETEKEIEGEERHMIKRWWEGGRRLLVNRPAGRKHGWCFIMNELIERERVAIRLSAACNRDRETNRERGKQRGVEGHALSAVRFIFM